MRSLRTSMSVLPLVSAANSGARGEWAGLVKRGGMHLYIPHFVTTKAIYLPHSIPYYLHEQMHAGELFRECEFSDVLGHLPRYTGGDTSCVRKYPNNN